MRPPICLAVLTALALLPAAHAGCVNSPDFDPATMMRTAELQRGMTGYGLTVFQGVEITRFDVEILGVLSKWNLGEDLILIKITSGPVVERQTGIIGGMSGSPIFVNDKLIGAIAYGWGFLREPMGGVTPIESMLDGWHEGSARAVLPTDHPLRGACVQGRWVDRVRVATTGPAFADARTLNLRPVGAPVSVAGFGQTGMKRLRELLEPFGMEAMPGPGPLRDPVPVELRPGAALGARLMEGDFDVSAVGTLTWRDGDRILAFGHPLLQAGTVSFPMSTGYIHDILPSMQHSNKASSPMQNIGAITLDGAWSIAGSVGAEAPMVPGHFTVTDRDRNLTREFNVRVAQQELLTPGLLMSALSSALDATYYAGSDGIGALDFELCGDQGTIIRRHDVIYHQGMPQLVTSWIDEAMYYMTENRFRREQVTSLRASVSLTGEERLAAIERVYTDEHVARAGEQLTVHVVMRPESGERFEQVVRFDLPANLPKGSMRVGAVAGADEYTLRSWLRLLMPQIDSLEDIARIVESTKRADQLYVAIALPRVTVGMEGTELPRLPSNAITALAANEADDLVAGYTEVSHTLDSEYYLYGLGYALLPTENRMGERGTIKRGTEENGAKYAQAVQGGALPHMWWAANTLRTGARPLGVGVETQSGDIPAPEPTEEEAPALVIDTNDEAEPEPDASEDAEEKAEETGEHPEPDDEALARGLSSFVHTDADDFEKGRAEGTMVRSDGTVMLAPRAEVIATADEPVIWSLAADGPAVWFGTGNPGRVYRRQPGAEAVMLCDTGSPLVLSLLPLGDGSALAGTGPDGRVLRIAADGAVTVAHELPVTYVWALARLADGGIVAGTGPEGHIYRLGERAEVLATVSQPHVLALAVAGERLYAGGGDDQAAVYEIAADGGTRQLFGTTDGSCTGIAVADDGRLLVVTANAGKAWLVEPAGRGREVYASNQDVLHAAAFVNGCFYAGTADDGKLVAINGAGQHGVALQDRVSEQIVRLAAGDGVLYAAAAGPARVWRMDLTATTEGIYRSAALDGERYSRWAHFEWDATVPAGATLQVDVRSGNSKTPEDGSWSAWTGALTTSGDPIAAPPARYAQYRLRLGGSYTVGPEVRRAALFYLPQNRQPKLTVSKPKSGDAMRGKFKLTWEAQDDDKDTMVASICTRPAGGGEWTLMETVEDETSWEWDTTGVADGRYDLKFVLSDEPSNPVGAESDEAVIEDVTVDNGYPKIVLLGIPRRTDRPLEILGLATDALSRITSIDWTPAGKERWRAVVARDGLLDANTELFTVSLPELPEDETAVKLRVRDAAGNVTVETITLRNGEPLVEIEHQPVEDSDIDEAEAKG